MQTARPQDTGGARTALPAALPDARHLVKIGHMRYVMSNKWSLTEHFVITDGAGNPCFDVRGNLGLTQRLSFCNQAGEEIAEIRKHLMTTAHDILIGGQPVAEVRHTGFFGERYDIDSSFGQFTAKGSFTGWDYSISHNGQLVAMISRELAFRERFVVETADGMNDVFLLAVVLAIDAIHDERRERNRSGFGGFGGSAGGGLLGGTFP